MMTDIKFIAKPSLNWIAMANIFYSESTNIYIDKIDIY